MNIYRLAVEKSKQDMVESIDDHYVACNTIQEAASHKQFENNTETTYKILAIDTLGEVSILS